MIPFLSSVSVFLGIKSSVDKAIGVYLIRYALGHNENVAARLSHGTIEIVATGHKDPPKLE